QKAGYATAHYGKWHLANNMIPDSPTPDHYGYDEYGAFNCAGEQMPYSEDALHTNNFIEKSHDAGKPFFINLWVHEPHTPFHTSPKYEWMSRDLDRPDNIYASVLAHADDRIGEVLNKLDELGIADNTLVIFSSDNGPARAAKPGELKLFYDTATGAGWGINAAKGVTGGRKGYKASIMEGGIGVPFLVRWPSKVKAGAVNSVSPISAVDLLPTFCEIAGAKLPDDYVPDGISQVAALNGTNTEPKRTKPLFWKIGATWPIKKSKPDHWASYAVAHQEWKLLTNKDSSYVELYNIVSDPFEKNDLKKSQPEAVKTLLKKLKTWQETLPVKPTGNVFSKFRKK
ncbi:MAG: sulfatase-like hydrolase/transferase, partial [Lentisphaeraceae bacterium]|nr:sulfatase-like hydrolase/transferase [Lentisphaeraceae bacterium]